MEDPKEKYRRVLADEFPDTMKIILGDQELEYRKRSWSLPDGRGNVVEKGLRYGENPDQKAALYTLVSGSLKLGDTEYISAGRGLISSLNVADMIQAGKHPGKINFTDVDNALNILRYLTKKPACAIMKHNNPSGAAMNDSLRRAYHKANMADRIAAFGGAAVFNRPVDKETAELVAANYLEVVAAPSFEEGAVDILKRRKNLRILAIPGINELETYTSERYLDFKSLIDGGIIVQQSSVNRILSADDLVPARVERDGKIYETERAPTERELEDMVFGWAVEQGVTSNSVIYVKDGCTVGIGTGEQDRVGVAQIAVVKAYTKYMDRLCFERHGVPFNEMMDESTRRELHAETNEKRGGLIGSVMVSDAFFPFRDGVDVGIAEGVSAIVHPGGSERDWESIEACNQANPQVAMMFTNQRAFKH